MAPVTRDPVSLVFPVAGIRRHLDRAYDRPEQWTGRLLAVPSSRVAAQLQARGIRWAGPDVSMARGGGGLNTRTRWARGYVRAVSYQHRWFSGGRRGGWRPEKRTEPSHYGAIEYRVGRAIAATDGRPAGRMVYLCYHPRGGSAAQDAKNRKRGPVTFEADGSPGQLQADLTLRDW